LKILVTGASGFIAGYLIDELLKRGHRVVGIDNFSKYGPVRKSYDHHKNYRFVRGDVKAAKLVIDEGAVFDGRISMTENRPSGQNY